MVLSLVARSDFAIFAVCITTYLLAVQVTRATFGVPVTLLLPHSSQTAEHRAAVGAGVALGLVAGSVSILVAIFAQNGRTQLLVLGLALPFLLWQDMVRYVYFARGHPETAAAADGLWLVVQMAASLVTITTGHATAATLLGAWAAGGAVSAVVFGISRGLTPRLFAALGWVRHHGALSRRLIIEFTVAAGSHYCVYYVLAIVAGADQLGRLKAAQTMLGPVIVLLLGGGVLGVPESVRAAHQPRLVRRLAVRLSSILAVIAVSWGLLAYIILPSLGPTLFHDTWATARPLLPALTLFSLSLCASLGATSALRALGGSPWLLRVRTISGPLLVLLSFPAAARFAANGAILALAFVEGAVATLAWRHLMRLTGSSQHVSLNDNNGPNTSPARPTPGAKACPTTEAGRARTWRLRSTDFGQSGSHKTSSYHLRRVETSSRLADPTGAR